MLLLLRRIQSMQAWASPDDYVVQFEGQAVGCIFRADAAPPEGTPWMWTVEFHQRRGRPGPHQGYTTDLDSAMRAFRRVGIAGGMKSPPVEAAGQSR
jgi:hypothetical protein